jgi:hypothetical protein
LGVTIGAITALCPSSGLTILSRWRDRGFGRTERLLPTAIDYLLDHGHIHPKTALSLVGFRAQWDLVQLVRRALKVCTSDTEKTSAFDFAYGYMRLEEHGPSTWRELEDVVGAQGLTVSSIDELIAFSEQRELLERRDSTDTEELLARPEDEQKQRNWNAIFEGMDLGSRQGISQAHGRFRKEPAPYYHDHFFNEACRRVTAGKETDFIRAFALVPDFNLYHLRALLEQLPEAWKDRLAVQSALADTLRSFCRHHCMDIARSRYYQILPFKTASELSGIAESESPTLLCLRSARQHTSWALVGCSLWSAFSR